jgi:hypothetical protein
MKKFISSAFLLAMASVTNAYYDEITIVNNCSSLIEVQVRRTSYNNLNETPIGVFTVRPNKPRKLDTQQTIGTVVLDFFEEKIHAASALIYATNSDYTELEYEGRLFSSMARLDIRPSNSSCDFIHCYDMNTDDCHHALNRHEEVGRTKSCSGTTNFTITLCPNFTPRLTTTSSLFLA